MAKRGPKPGTYYKKFVVTSWGQHREADRFSDALGKMLDELERSQSFPQSDLRGVGLATAINALNTLQGRVIEGMAQFVERENQTVNPLCSDD